MLCPAFTGSYVSPLCEQLDSRLDLRLRPQRKKIARRMRNVPVIISIVPPSKTERDYSRPKAWAYCNLPGQVNRMHGEEEDPPDVINTITDDRMNATEPRKSKAMQ